MNTRQKINIFIVNKKYYFFVFFVHVFGVHIIYFFSDIFCDYALHFCGEVSSNKYHYCAIFVQRLSSYWASAASTTFGCSIEISLDWTNEASPTLGCSIEISRGPCLSCTKIRRPNYVQACSKSVFGG